MRPNSLQRKKSKPSKTVLWMYVTFNKSTNLYILVLLLVHLIAVYSFIYFRVCQFQSPILSSTTLQHQFSQQSVFWVASFFLEPLCCLAPDWKFLLLMSNFSVSCGMFVIVAGNPAQRQMWLCAKTPPDSCHSSIHSLKPSTLLGSLL